MDDIEWRHNTAEGRTNSKQDMGSTGILTDGIMKRFELYEHAMILAMIPFVHEAKIVLK